LTSRRAAISISTLLGKLHHLQTVRRYPTILLNERNHENGSKGHVAQDERTAGFTKMVTRWASAEDAFMFWKSGSSSSWTAPGLEGSGVTKLPENQKETMRTGKNHET
jgi:hypothetical protein